MYPGYGNGNPTIHHLMGDREKPTGILSKDHQAGFFDEHPPIYPWPKLLRRSGLDKVCKPREAMWKRALDEIGLQRGDSILDLGCGTGIWLDRLAAHFGTVGTGLDVSAMSLKAASAESGNQSDLSCGDASTLPFRSGSFDFVLCLDVLEHIEGRAECLSEIARVLRPDGSLFLWTLNQRQEFTWNWWLDKLGVDVYDRAAHDPRHLPSDRLVAQTLRENKMAFEGISYFNSFFTLALDEAIMVIVSLLDRTGVFESQRQIASVIGKFWLFCADKLSRHTLRILDWMDVPWRRRGHSNGFLIVARKMNSIDPDPARESQDEDVELQTGVEIEARGLQYV